jgi:hypothetical protein
MKKAAIFLCVFLVAAVPFCSSQDDSYRNEVDKIVKQAETLQDFCGSGSIDFSSYCKWCADFTGLYKDFVNNFSSKHIKKASFKAIREGMNNVDLAWYVLKQANDEDQQYAEAISRDSITAAHNWKRSSVQHQEKFHEIIAKALDCFDQAERIAASGDIDEAK